MYDYFRGSQPFRACGTLIFEEGFGGTPRRIKLTKIMTIWLPCKLSSKFKDSAAHFEKFDGTLVRRGTPVEKHWIACIIVVVVVSKNTFEKESV